MDRIIYIEGSKCAEKQDLFSSFSQALNFPGYFSNNWDSFEEIINDLEPGEGYSIIIKDWKKVLANDHKSKSILRKILKMSNKRNPYVFFRLKKIGE